MPEASVVRIYATSQEPDYDSPWQSEALSHSTGSGVVIGERRVLTGAHVIADATFVQVQRVADPDKMVAQVVAVCHDSDLALLEVDDPRFADGTEIATLGDLPNPRDRVSVIGFPVGGDELSITEGVVSRIEVTRYSHSQRFLLAVTVDAAINRGNSGGPVFRGDEVVGVAFQALSDAENIGELVPAPIVRRFLDAVSSARPTAVPGLGFSSQHLENPLLRRRVGLGERDSGVLVRHVEYGGSAFGVIEPGDAVLRIGEYRIANNGTAGYRGAFRTRFDVVLGELFVGDPLELEILRAGQRHTVTIDLKPYRALVPRRQYDVRPTYFIYAGLVFQVLTCDYLSTWNRWWDNAPKEFLYLYYHGRLTADRQQVVILTHVLDDEINVGYSEFHNESIVTIDGERPRDMRDFVRRIESHDGIVEMIMSYGGRIALDARQARAAGPRILDHYRIPADRSPDLVGS